MMPEVQLRSKSEKSGSGQVKSDKSHANVSKMGFSQPSVKLLEKTSPTNILLKSRNSLLNVKALD